MGNHTSCCYVDPQIAKLLDVHGNLRRVKLPITAAEIMIEDPGHVISPAEDFRRTLRFAAMRADEELSAGKVYVLLPAGRVHCKVSESEIAMLESTCERRRAKRRSSKVQPAVTAVGGDKEEGPVRVLGGNDTGLTGYRLGNHGQWRPVLEPICEAI